MIIHLTPKFYIYGKAARSVCIDRVEIPTFGLDLAGGIDIVNRKPFPNKHYTVVCRKKGNKAINGILIDAQEPISEFNISISWLIGATRLNHHVHYTIEDPACEATSEDMVLWYEHTVCNEHFPCRIVPEYKNYSPVARQPRMSNCQEAGRVADAMANDVVHDGMLIERTESFKLPALERSRVLGGGIHRYRHPSETSIFSIN